MIRYDIEIKYMLNGAEETRNMYYKAIDVLNDEQQEEVVQDFINGLKSFYGVSTILETHIWEHGKDKEKINLNKLKNYKALAYAGPVAQLNKVKEEYQELLNEVEIKNDEFRICKDSFEINFMKWVTLQDINWLKSVDYVDVINEYKNNIGS